MERLRDRGSLTIIEPANLVSVTSLGTCNALSNSRSLKPLGLESGSKIGWETSQLATESGDAL